MNQYKNEVAEVKLILAVNDDLSKQETGKIDASVGLKLPS
jgi:hypothetical protein